ncbi:MAG TPA: sensor histidine kinase [Thermoleophilaceae bacterium]|nr:sensor histidine kinase [Thermoleophilaceae bacterium]
MAGAKLRHDAFVYESDEQFGTQMSQVLLDGLDEGAAAVAVTSRGNWALLRDVLGERASSVDFMDRDEFYLRPAKALARYDVTLRHHLGLGAPEVRVLGEVQFGPTEKEWGEWTAYEALVNRAFADKAAWIICPYDARVLPQSVIDDASRTHPNVITRARHASSLYGGVEAVTSALAPQYEPLPQLETLPPAPDGQTFRDLLAARLAAAGVPGARTLDMLVAANEVYVNAVQHAGGVTLVRTGRVEGRFVCEITDAGAGIDDPDAGYVPPSSEDAPGAGLWVARQLTRRLDLLASPQGLTARLWL